MFRLTILCILLFSSISLMGQEKVDLEKINLNKNPKQEKLGYKVLVENIASGNICYNLAVSISYVEKQMHNFKHGPEQAYAESIITIKEGRLNSENRLLSSSNNFSATETDRFEVTMEANSTGEIDANQIKIVWEIPSIGKKIFLLENVTIHKDTYGITIIGNAVLDDKFILSVCMCIAEVICLI